MTARIQVARAVALLLAAAPGCAKREPDVRPSASDGPVTVTLSTNRTLIGEPFTLEAGIQTPAGARVEFPSPGLPPAVVPRNSRSLEESPVARRQVWELMGLRTGSHVVWTGAIRQIDAAGRVSELAIPPLRIEVAPGLDPRDLSARDLAGLQHWPRRIWERVLAVLALVAALAAALAWGLRRLQRRRRRAVAPPAVPPHEAAWTALQALRAGGLPDTPADVEAFFVKLSDIVRRYLEDGFDLRAPEQTTEEFIRAAGASQNLTVPHQQLVAGFLEQSDLVKFARYTPQTADMTAAFDAALRLVEETRPAPANPLAAPPAHTS